MKVPILRPYVDEREANAVKEVLESGWMIMGRKVGEFEEMVRQVVGTDYAKACTSCTTALHMALLALGIGPGDKVLVPAYTFVATANAVEYTGAEVIFVDVDSETFNMNTEDALTKYYEHKDDIKAIIPVHLFGLCARMGELLQIKGAHIIEDAACALGSYGPEGMAGAVGDIGCFPWQTSILTENGKVVIKKIKKGDRVRTVSGEYGIVTELFRRKYEGRWCKLSFHFTRNRKLMGKTVTMTSEHPVLTYRNNKREWVFAQDLEDGDWVYIHKGVCRHCGKEIPALWQYCEYCNPAQTDVVRRKIAKAKDTGKARPKYRFKHYFEDILPFAKKLSSEGYRVIPIGVAVPDIIAIKDGKVYAYEIENTLPRKRKLEKYDTSTSQYYDDIIWIGKEKVKSKKKVAVEYEIDGNLARIRIKAIKKYFRKTPVWVYNLEVSGDHTYFAGGVAVHNCFSFHPRKSIATGEGGMMTTNDKYLAEMVHQLRDFGFTGTNLERHEKGVTLMPEVNLLGYNYRMTDIHGAIGVEQMKKWDEIVHLKRAKADAYGQELADVDWLATPVVPEGYYHTYQSYACRVLPPADRGEVMNQLKEAGVATREGTHAVPLLGYYAKKYGYKTGDFPGMDACDRQCITIPMFPSMTQDEQSYVIEAIKKVRV